MHRVSFGESFKGRLALLKSYADFPLKQMPNAAINAMQQQAPVFILAAFFDSQVVGYYGLATAVITRPVGALADAVSRVYLQRLVAMDPKDMYADIKQITIVLASLALPFCLVLGIYGDRVFSTVFGENWVSAGKMAALMTPWIFALVVNIPTTQLLLVRRELRFILVFNVTYALLRIAALLACVVVFGDVYIAILVFSVIGFLGNVVYLGKVLVIAKNAR